MRNEIIKLGGEFLFNEKVTDFEFENSKVTAVICSKRIETDTVILAIGHSARSTFEKLYEKGVKMEKKLPRHVITLLRVNQLLMEMLKSLLKLF